MPPVFVISIGDREATVNRLLRVITLRGGDEEEKELPWLGTEAIFEIGKSKIIDRRKSCRWRMGNRRFLSDRTRHEYLYVPRRDAADVLWREISRRDQWPARSGILVKIEPINSSVWRVNYGQRTVPSLAEHRYLSTTLPSPFCDFVGLQWLIKCPDDGGTRL